MKKIKLTKGKFAIVDDADYLKVFAFKWCIGNTGHVVRRCDDSNENYMVNLIKRKPNDMRFLFKNRNPLDLRQCNIEVVTYAIQSVYANKTKSKTSSLYKGVYYDKFTKKYVAYLTKRNKDGKRERLLYKYFTNEKDAARCRNNKAKEIFGTLTYQNKISLH